MSELDDRQNVILQAWGRGELVIVNSREFGAQHAMINAVSNKRIADHLFNCATSSGPCFTIFEDLHEILKQIAREQASIQMGFSFITDAETETKENAGE